MSYTPRNQVTRMEMVPCHTDATRKVVEYWGVKLYGEYDFWAWVEIPA